MSSSQRIVRSPLSLIPLRARPRAHAPRSVLPPLSSLLTAAAAALPPPPTQKPSQQAPRAPALPAAATQLASVLSGLHHTFVVADNTLPDCPLVYASEG